MAEPKGISDRRLTLHFGVQKTASTALHHFVERNRARLAGKLTVLTPVMGTPAQRMGRAAMRYSLDPSAELRQNLIDRVRTVRVELEGIDDTPVLLSHENLPGAMIGNGGVTTLYPRLEDILAIIGEHLAPFTPSFAFYTRDMPAWKKSVHNQAVKTDGYAGTLDSFLSDTAEAGDWSGLRARVEGAVGADRTHFFALEDEVVEGHPGQQLLALAGLSIDDLSQLEALDWRPNESLNAGSLEFMRQINKQALGDGPRDKVLATVKRHQALFAQTLTPQHTEAL